MQDSTPVKWNSHLATLTGHLPPTSLTSSSTSKVIDFSTFVLLTIQLLIDFPSSKLATPPVPESVTVYPSSTLALVTWKLNSTGGYPIKSISIVYQQVSTADDWNNPSWHRTFPEELSPTAVDQLALFVISLMNSNFIWLNRLNWKFTNWFRTRRTDSEFGRPTNSALVITPKSLRLPKMYHTIKVKKTTSKFEFLFYFIYFDFLWQFKKVICLWETVSNRIHGFCRWAYWSDRSDSQLSCWHSFCYRIVELVPAVRNPSNLKTKEFIFLTKKWMDFC